jgi:hypothetical protein
MDCIAGGKAIDLKYCEYGSVYILGYVLAIFIEQMTLKTLMKYKKGQKARTAFAMMVPLTALAFFIAIATFNNANANDINIIN